MGNKSPGSTVDLPIIRCRRCFEPVVWVRADDARDVEVDPKGVTVGDLVFDAKRHRRHRCRPKQERRAA